MNYHIARNTEKLGEFSLDALIERHRRGELRPDDLIWREGMAEWTRVAVWLNTPEAAPVRDGGAALHGSAVPPPTPTSFRAPPPGAIPPKPSNNLVWAILATFFCCLPFGIPAIVFASQVDGKYATGDYAGAAASADKARMWAWIAFGVGLVGSLLYIAVMFVGAAASAR